MKKKLLIVGDDKIGRRAICRAREDGLNFEGFSIGIDCSTSIARLAKLLRGKRISLDCLLRLIISDAKRKSFPRLEHDYRIENNSDLFKVLKASMYDEVCLFRAGLVISKRNLMVGTRFLNIHCADVQDYGGLCSIYRALKDKALQQHACLHVVTTKIDDPNRIIDREPFTLEPNRSYFENEEIAYEAGQKILFRMLSDSC